MEGPSRPYGLVLPSKKPRGDAGKRTDQLPFEQKRRRLFDDDDDDDDDDLDEEADRPHRTKDTMKDKMKDMTKDMTKGMTKGRSQDQGEAKQVSSRTTPASLLLLPNRPSHTKQTVYEAMQEAALAQDATAFDYDDVYDDMKSKVAAQHTTSQSDQQRTSKYIVGMLTSAQERARNELRIQERKIQREREAEKGTYGETLEFVTSAYKAHVEEVKVLEEKERLQAEKDDVTKKKDEMTGFYRTLLDRRARPAVDAMGPLQRESERELVPPPAAVSSTAAAPSVQTVAKVDGTSTADGSGRRGAEQRDAMPAAVAPKTYDEELRAESLRGGLNILRQARRPQKPTAADDEALAEQQRLRQQRANAYMGDPKVRQVREQALLTQFEDKQQNEQNAKEQEEKALKEKYQRKTKEEELAVLKQRALERKQKRS